MKEFVVAFKNEYLNQRQQDELQERLRSRKQGNTKSPREYFAALSTMTMALEKVDKEWVLRHFRSTLVPDVRRHLHLQEGVNDDDCVERAERI